jgi:predicted NAD-dependent protein-ADP-ribosyltransferase YbiA (DUF1768 family)
LIDTTDKELVEAAPNDRVWGVEFDERMTEVNRENEGQNLLEKASISGRERIRDYLG